MPLYSVASQFDSFWFEELFKILIFLKLCYFFSFRGMNMPAKRQCAYIFSIAIMMFTGQFDLHTFHV